MTEDLSQFVPKVYFEQIPIKNLVSNQDYQRTLSMKHVRRVAENFDLYQINPVKVSRRDGVNYVFNGQHTIEIVAMISGSRDTPVWCMIYDDLNYKQEAHIFANQMKDVKTLQPIEIFMANVESCSDKHLIIKDLIESYGLTIGTKKATCCVNAIATAENIFDAYGFQVLNRTLRLIVGAWEGESNSLSGNMLKGVAKLVVVFGEQLRDDVFCEKLGSVSIKQLSRTASERRAGSLGYAEAMIIIYNGKGKNILHWKKLYALPNSSYEDTSDDGDIDSEDI